jgi:Spy/CpxP family protein refolding chaperone
MKTNKIIAGAIATSILVTGLWVASADFGEIKNNFKNHKIELTEEQKTQIESMSQDEKKAFFQTKKTEMHADREAKENVIDKLLAGETLTSDEEILKDEIIVQRAEKKLKMEERQANKEEMKTIIDKKKNGEALTQDEEAKLEEMKSHGKKWGKKGWKWGKGEKNRGER